MFKNVQSPLFEHFELCIVAGELNGDSLLKKRVLLEAKTSMGNMFVVRLTKIFIVAHITFQTLVNIRQVACVVAFQYVT